MNYGDTTMTELIQLTKKFIMLADQLLKEGRITGEEYDELTYIKKNFLKEVQAE